MRNGYLVVLLSSFLTAAPALAQVTVGVLPSNLNSSDANFPTPQTDVSLENPATGAGRIVDVTFGWNATCNGVAKIKFFRRTGNTLTMLAERGPFDTGGGRNQHSVVMSPGVDVLAGDLIGITRVVSCGNTLAEAGTGTLGYVVLQGDATTGTVSAGNTFHDKLGLTGTAASPGNVTGGIITVVGSTAGSLGSNFKTSAQLLNPSDNGTISGRFIFHQATRAGSQADPSLLFTVLPGGIVVYPDLVVAMGQSGLGSIDIVTPPGAPLPIITTRIYNDAGSGGTAGFFEDVIGSATGAGTRVLISGTTGFLMTPVEPTRTRMNFGVRSLSGGAIMTVRLEDAEGHVFVSTQKSYPPDYFEQVDSGTFLNGVALGANLKVRIMVSSGSAIVYGATTDNVTHDPSVQFATAVPNS
jgi:hypothetical protein